MKPVLIRVAVPHDAVRLIQDEIVASDPESLKRLRMWFAEIELEHRIMLVAEHETKLCGYAQLLMQFPGPIKDPAAADGRNTAMIDTLHVGKKAPAEVSQHLYDDLLAIAKRRHFKTITFCVSAENQPGINRAKQWGFKEFRIMPEGRKVFIMFRKILQP